MLFSGKQTKETKMNAYVVSTIDGDAVLPLADTAVFSKEEKAKEYALRQVKVYNDNGLLEDDISKENDYWWHLECDGSAVDIFIDETNIQ